MAANVRNGSVWFVASKRTGWIGEVGGGVRSSMKVDERAPVVREETHGPPREKTNGKYREKSYPGIVRAEADIPLQATRHP
jgi:hypothetical protein